MITWIGPPGAHPLGGLVGAPLDPAWIRRVTRRPSRLTQVKQRPVGRAKLGSSIGYTPQASHGAPHGPLTSQHTLFLHWRSRCSGKETRKLLCVEGVESCWGIEFLTATAWFVHWSLERSNSLWRANSQILPSSGLGLGHWRLQLFTSWMWHQWPAPSHSILRRCSRFMPSMLFNELKHHVTSKEFLQKLKSY